MSRSTQSFWTAALLGLAGCGQADSITQRQPTPEIDSFESIEVPEGWALGARVQLPGTGDHVGMAAVCSNQRLTITVSLGAFPASGRAVQLSVRRPDETVERFGPVVQHRGPSSGFHSPQLTAADEIRRFLEAALRPGSLVSNGYNSFLNRLSAEQNERQRRAILSCGT